MIEKIRKYRLILLAIPIVYGFLSCGEKIDEFDGFIKPEIIQMLTAGTNKNWIRIERTVDGQPITGSCSDSLVAKFMRIINEKTDTTGYLFINPVTQICSLSDFCGEHPEICNADTLFCSKNSAVCDDLEENFIFAGSWYIPEPVVKNGTVNQLLLSNAEGSVTYQFDLITSANLELTSVNFPSQMFEKYKSE